MPTVQPPDGNHANDPTTGPRTDKVRTGCALCLSGGGYRAALFHLGALARLNELGILAKIDTVSCVSGGSILGAFLAGLFKTGYIPKAGIYEDFWTLAVEDFLPFVTRDIRTGAVLRQLQFWKKGAGPEALAARYEALTSGMKLQDLPEKPLFIFCATDLVFGVSWEACRTHVGDWIAGYVSPPPDHWTVAKAVAASSCFPPIFFPLPTGIPGTDFKRKNGTPPADLLGAWREKIGLTDGGVYDNLGLEPVWKSHATVLVSDGGAPMKPAAPVGAATIMRYAGVIGNQVGALRKRWLIDIFERNETGQPQTFNGTYWGVESATTRYVPTATHGYSKDLSSGTIAMIRTDLDPFSPNECWVLIKHGYELADIALRTHEPGLIAIDAPRRVWPSKLQDENLVRKALNNSHKRRYLIPRANVKENSLLVS